MSLKFIYITLSQASVLLPIAFGLLNRKRLTPSFRLLYYFFLACLGFEVLAVVTKTIYHNNMPGLHLFTIIQFFAFSAFYCLNFSNSKAAQGLIVINVIPFLVLAIADAFFLNGIMVTNTLSRSYAFVSLLLYSLMYFYYLFQSDEIQYSTLHPMFWLCLGALIYFGNNMLYFMLKKQLLIKASKIETISYFAHAAFNIIAHCLYAQSFRCFRKQKV